jgi:hypothetical protein
VPIPNDLLLLIQDLEGHHRDLNTLLVELHDDLVQDGRSIPSRDELQELADLLVGYAEVVHDRIDVFMTIVETPTL